jgi:hypothetical protein
MLMPDQCPAETIGVRCQLDAGHNSPHRNEDRGGTTTWEPRYVGDLRRAVEDMQRDPWRFHLKEVLDAIGPELTCEAIQDANETLDNAERRDQALSHVSDNKQHEGDAS